MRISFPFLFLALTVFNISTSQPSWSMDVEFAEKPFVCNGYVYSASRNGTFEIRYSTPGKPEKGTLKEGASGQKVTDLTGSAPAGVSIGDIVFAGSREEIRNKLWSAVLDARQSREPAQIGQLAKHFELLGYVSYSQDMWESSVPFYTDHAFCIRDLAFEPRNLEPKTVIAYGKWARTQKLSDELGKKIELLCPHFFVHRDNVGSCFDEILKEIPKGEKFDYMVDGLARLLGVFIDRIPPESVGSKQLCLDILIRLSRERHSLESYFSLLERGFADTADLSKEVRKKLDDAISKDRRYQHTLGISGSSEESNISKAYKNVAPRVKEYLGGVQVEDDELVNMLYVLNQVRELTIKKLKANPSDAELVKMQSIAHDNFNALMRYIANKDPGGYSRFTTVMSKMIQMNKESSQEVSRGA